jgi:hypothetical protein
MGVFKAGNLNHLLPNTYASTITLVLLLAHSSTYGAVDYLDLTLEQLLDAQVVSAS